MKERNKFLLLIALFLAAYFIPFGHPRVSKAILEGFFMLQEYVQEHVLLCLVPALFIAGAISCFLSQRAVIKYFGGETNKWTAYLVGSVSGLDAEITKITDLNEILEYDIMMTPWLVVDGKIICSGRLPKKG